MGLTRNDKSRRNHDTSSKSSIDEKEIEIPLDEEEEKPNPFYRRPPQGKNRNKNRSNQHNAHDSRIIELDPEPEKNDPEEEERKRREKFFNGEIEEKEIIVEERHHEPKAAKKGKVTSVNDFIARGKKDNGKDAAKVEDAEKNEPGGIEVETVESNNKGADNSFEVKTYDEDKPLLREDEEDGIILDDENSIMDTDIEEKPIDKNDSVQDNKDAVAEKVPEEDGAREGIEVPGHCENNNEDNKPVEEKESKEAAPDEKEKKAAVKEELEEELEEESKSDKEPEKMPDKNDDDVKVEETEQETEEKKENRPEKKSVLLEDSGFSDVVRTISKMSGYEDEGAFINDAIKHEIKTIIHESRESGTKHFLTASGVKITDNKKNGKKKSESRILMEACAKYVGEPSVGAFIERAIRNFADLSFDRIDDFDFLSDDDIFDEFDD